MAYPVELLTRLGAEGGHIVLRRHCTPGEVSSADAEGRSAVSEDGQGIVFMGPEQLRLAQAVVPAVSTSAPPAVVAPVEFQVQLPVPQPVVPSAPEIRPAVRLLMAFDKALMVVCIAAFVVCVLMFVWATSPGVQRHAAESQSALDATYGPNYGR